MKAIVVLTRLTVTIVLDVLIVTAVCFVLIAKHVEAVCFVRRVRAVMAVHIVKAASSAFPAARLDVLSVMSRTLNGIHIMKLMIHLHLLSIGREGV